MLVFFNDGVLSCRSEDGVFERAPSDLLERQAPHVEGPDRIANIAAILRRGPLADALTWRQARSATDEEICFFHTPAYLATLKAADGAGRWFTATTHLPAGGLAMVRLAAGAAIGAAGAVMRNEAKSAYALARPPGHHAQPDRADGYCFVNGTALAALTGLELGARRVAVIDWDVHHGNGTEEGFYERDDILTISIHMNHGAWGVNHQQTGEVDAVGRGAGEGFNLNLPLPFGLGDHCYSEVFRRCIAPAVRRFAPDLLVIANGQDAGQFDPNGRMCLSLAGFHDLGRQAAALADEVCEGRVVLVQEGGYNPTHAAFCVHGSLSGVIARPLGLEDPLSFYPEDRATAEAAVDALVKRHPLLT